MQLQSTVLYSKIDFVRVITVFFIFFLIIYFDNTSNKKKLFFGFNDENLNLFPSLTMDYFSSIDDDDLTNAAYLLQLVDRISFSASNAIFAVSSDTGKGTNPDCIRTVNTALFAL